jgi:hypothetical protein
VAGGEIVPPLAGGIPPVLGVEPPLPLGGAPPAVTGTPPVEGGVGGAPPVVVMGAPPVVTFGLPPMTYVVPPCAGGAPPCADGAPPCADGAPPDPIGTPAFASDSVSSESGCGCAHATVTRGAAIRRHTARFLPAIALGLSRPHGDWPGAFLSSDVSSFAARTDSVAALVPDEVTCARAEGTRTSVPDLRRDGG